MKNYAKQCIKETTTMKATMLCASCDNKNESKFSNGISIKETMPNEVIKACVPLLYMYTALVKPALIRFLKYTHSVDNSVNVDAYVSGLNAFNPNLESCIADYTQVLARDNQKAMNELQHGGGINHASSRLRILSHFKYHSRFLQASSNSTGSTASTSPTANASTSSPATAGASTASAAGASTPTTSGSSSGAPAASSSGSASHANYHIKSGTKQKWNLSTTSSKTLDITITSTVACAAIDEVTGIFKSWVFAP